MPRQRKTITWIETIPKAEAEGDIVLGYKRSTGKSGDVDHMMQIHSLSLVNINFG